MSTEPPDRRHGWRPARAIRAIPWGGVQETAPMRVAASVVVRGPIAEVFAYVADFRNDPAWRSEVREMRYLSDGPPAVGTRVRETSVLWGRRVVTESVLTVFEPGRRVAFAAVSGPFRVSGSRSFEPVAGGTRVTSVLEWHPTSRLARLVAPAMGRTYQRTIERYVARLPAILEGVARPSEAAT
jgi:uncharacterized membrane protein